jgi:tripartite-type tricarboxylate transporter receptor subunit TctC
MMKRILSALCAAAVSCAAHSQAPQSYPSKPIRILSAFGPGNPADTSLRVVTQKMGESMGQPLLVEPQTVASGVGAAQIVMRAPADGYTILYVLPSMLMIPPFLIKNKPFDPLKDFTPITSVVDGPIAIAVNTSFPGNSVRDLIDLAKANPGKYSYGTNGIGGTYHLEMELFKQQFGIDLVQVPYKTSLEAVNALAGGEIPLAYAPVGAFLPLVRAGKMRLLVLLDYRRYPDLPNLAAMGEEIQDYQRIPTGLNFYGPAGLPPTVSRRLHAEVVKALALPDVQAKLKEMTFFGIGTAPDVLAAQQVKDYAIIAKAVKAAKIEPQ